ncbi:MAG TPA: LysR family transcriptional regulator [Dokdonella sp.]
MFVRQLTYLVALSRERHFGRAAETCSVSQPALSAAIRNMEDELGLPIVQRRGRSFEGFTPEGERLLGWARQILADWSNLRQEAAGAREGLSGRLRMGAIPTALPVVWLLTEACLSVHPRIDHVVHSLSTTEIIRQLDGFELDIALTYLEDERLAHFDVMPLFRERYVLLARKGALREQPATISWQHAAELPLCLLTDNMQNRQIIDDAFKRAGAVARPRVETDSVIALYSHVRHAGLFSIVPHSLLSLFEMHDGVDTIPLVPELGRSIGLVARDRDPPSPLLTAAWTIFRGCDLQDRFDALISGAY